MSETEQDTAFLIKLCRDNDYPNAKPLGDGRYIALARMIYHCDLIVGEIGDECSVMDRWSYRNDDLAYRAFLDWNGKGDAPDGWQRHMRSGRRRPSGDAAQEYVSD